MALIIGLTGGIASGKTTVANLFHEHFQIELIDADVISREVVEPGSAGLNAIIQRYGEEILSPDSTLNRSALRDIIFSNPEEKSWLNQLLHPMIRKKMHADIQQVRSPYALLVIPLMVENKLQVMADRVLVVDVAESVQITRTMARDGVSEQQARTILQAQASREQRLAIADDVIRNDVIDQPLLPQVTQLHHQYLALCRAKHSS